MTATLKGLIIVFVIFLLNGCAYYSYGIRSSYGLTNVDTTEYVGHLRNTGYTSPIFSPVITLKNQVQFKIRIPGNYNLPLGRYKSEYFNHLRMELFITSLQEGLRLDTQHITLNQYRVGKQTKVNFIPLGRHPSKDPSDYGVDVCMSSPERKFPDYLYDFYQGESIAIPHRQVDFNQLPPNQLRIDTQILCGNLVAMNTNLAGEQGFFTLTLPFIEAGETTEYTIYFYPVEFRSTIK
ncbi:hypothetical protein [Shewanella sp. Isolate7]|uniref:hypothetical protein n=1 Tax=Shewanella sp. Isolate7 TaxID=2908528 RepID=UPI001EFC472F|nr:hypothetical protein [Shewanella sp. Isolate7]MCG9723524.1 hypothetical protein [Shewanella sp. Isolate7]